MTFPDFMAGACIVGFIVLMAANAWRSYLLWLERDDPQQPKGPWTG